MPAVVSKPHEANQTACGYCHLPAGAGRPENAKLAGLPADYIVSQAELMHAGARGSALDGYRPLALMRASLEGLTPEELRGAAAYYAHRRPRAVERVIEAQRVPAFTARCFVLVAGPGSEQPLGERIVELADAPDRFELRDPRATYTAYVPGGSLGWGQALAGHGRAGLAACASCHGTDLRGGVALAGPPIAGRFAGYLARQIYGFRSGARQGVIAQPMRAVSAALSEGEVIDVVAYAASLKP